MKLTTKTFLSSLMETGVILFITGLYLAESANAKQSIGSAAILWMYALRLLDRNIRKSCPDWQY